MKDNSGLVDRNDEISLKDVLLKLGEHLREVLRSWIFIGVFACIVALIFFIRHRATPQEYRAECTFMLNDQDNSMGLGVTSLLGQFGLGGRGEFKLEKIADLSKSRAMASRVMFRKTTLNNEEGWLANHFIAEKEEQNTWAPHWFWEEPGPLAGFRFSHDSVDVFGRVENKALLTMHRLFTDDLTTEIDEITGILKFTIINTQEELAYELMESLFDEVSEYYTGKSVEKQQATYDALAQKCDSLEGLLNSKEYELANIRDSYRGQWLNREKVPQEKLQRDIRMLTLMYGEALKNKELAAFSLDNMTPFVQAIDRPILPLKKLKPIWWMAVLKGLIFGGGLAVAWIVGRKIFRDAMAE